MARLAVENRDVIGLMILLSVSLLANLLIHWLLVCPRLYRHGARFPTGWLFWRMFHELRSYRDFTAARGRPLTFYYLDIILSCFNLLLTFAFVLRLLWVQTHPGAF